MIKIKYLIFASLLLLFACDKIEEPYLRFSETDDSVDPSVCPRPVFTDRVNPVQKVLIEDFTGFLCPNCPTGAAEAKRLKGIHGEQLILLAVHTGEFAIPDPMQGFTQDFRTVTGDAIAAYYQIVSFPNGMVSRTPYRGSTVMFYDMWEGAIDSLTNLTPEIDLQIINEYDSASRKLCTHLQARFLQVTRKQLFLAVYLMEDSIHTKQKNNNPMIGSRPEIADYTQMHVLRKAVNSTWGSLILSAGDTMQVNDKINRSYAITLDNLWNAKHCTVVAFVYDANSKAILQVEEKKSIE